MKKLLTGNEAIAYSSYIHGVKFASGYPGTPSTEILENFAKFKDGTFAEWAPNEKVALESAIGASYAGARSLATMKHVGLNVAADPLFTNVYTGVNGGLIIISADEPGMHSSQNEQDNRHYARHAYIPMFEPSSSHEVFDMVGCALSLSETFDTPVLIRMTTRVCHSKSLVDMSGVRIDISLKEMVKNPSKYVAVPANARKLKYKLVEKQKKLLEYSNNSPYNYEVDNASKIGIISSGICFEYAKEVFGEDVSYFKVGFSYPLPIEKIKKFSKKVDKLYVIEENDPIMEMELKANGIPCTGKEIFPCEMELTPDIIRTSFYNKKIKLINDNKEKEAVGRPPTLCAGCPHRGLFYELGKLKNTYLSGDIGCYTLGFAKPYNALDTVTCMGASISSAHGAAKVFEMNDIKTKTFAVIGDSTFFHTGINSLMNVAYNKSNVTTIILDNRITGMTGHQENPGSGYTLMGEETSEIDIETLVRALLIKHVKTIDPNNLKEVKEALKWASELNEPNVIITRYPCILKKLTKRDNEEFNNPFTSKCSVNKDECINCKICLKSGCPAISINDKENVAQINEASCVGCEVCLQICPKNAIKKEGK